MLPKAVVEEIQVLGLLQLLAVAVAVRTLTVLPEMVCLEVLVGVALLGMEKQAVTETLVGTLL
jgi:hypothetical protein